MVHQILNRKSGNRLEVNDGETVLDAALRQGTVFPYSCRGGTCGSCKATLLSGEIKYATDDLPALSEQDARDNLILLCQAQPVTDIEIEVNEMSARADIQIKMLPCRVSRMERLAHDVMGLHLKLPATQTLPYLAGQYIDIIMRDGRRRSFSLASRPLPGQELELHIRHVPGGRFSGMVFESLSVKDLLRFQGPFGTFFLREDSDRPVILMAGGTGFAPIKSILEQAFHAGIQRRFHLFWGVRQRRDLYHHELVSSWAEQQDNFRYTPVLSEAAADDDWNGETGFVHQAVAASYPDLSGYEIYASGPPIMIESAQAAFPALGLDPDLLFFDSFEYATDV